MGSFYRLKPPHPYHIPPQPTHPPPELPGEEILWIGNLESWWTNMRGRRQKKLVHGEAGYRSSCRTWGWESGPVSLGPPGAWPHSLSHFQITERVGPRPSGDAPTPPSQGPAQEWAQLSAPLKEGLSDHRPPRWGSIQASCCDCIFPGVFALLEAAALLLGTKGL